MYINGKNALLQKVVFELRYKYGFTYLDKCGRTLNAIMRESPEWILRGTNPNPQTSGLMNMKNGCSFNFSAASLDVSLEKPSGGESLTELDVRDMVDEAELLSHVVIDQLGLNDFTRIGFRVWYLFGCDSKEEAEKWIRALGYYTVSPDLNKVFNGELDVSNFTAIIEGVDRTFRIGLNGVENQAQVDLGAEILNIRTSALSKDQDKVLRQQMKAKHRLIVNPGFAASIDVDAFQEKPVSVDVRDFIQTSIKQIEKGLQAAVTVA